MPLIPFNLLNYALGLTKLNIWHYIIASFVFMLPGSFAYTYLGSLGHTVLSGDKAGVVTKSLIAFSLLVILALGYNVF